MGLRNYRYFVQFVLCVCILAAFQFGMAVLALVEHAEESSEKGVAAMQVCVGVVLAFSPRRRWVHRE